MRRRARDIRQRIEKLAVEPDRNIYKLFVLHFLLIEHDNSANIDLIDDIIVISKANKLVLTCVMLKLIYYVIFKCDNSTIEYELKNRILKINRFLNPEDRSSKIIQNIEKDKLGRKHGSCR